MIQMTLFDEEFKIGDKVKIVGKTKIAHDSAPLPCFCWKLNDVAYIRIVSGFRKKDTYFLTRTKSHCGNSEILEDECGRFAKEDLRRVF